MAPAEVPVEGGPGGSGCGGGSGGGGYTKSSISTSLIYWGFTPEEEMYMSESIPYHRTILLSI